MHPGAEDRDDRERKDDQRERHQHVEEALQDEVGPAAEIGAAHADHQTDRAANEGAGEAHDHRGLRAEEYAREHVAAELVGAQEMRPARRLRHGAEIVRGGVEGGEPVRRNRGECHQEHQEHAEGAEWLVRAERKHDPERGARDLAIVVGDGGASL